MPVAKRTSTLLSHVLKISWMFEAPFLGRSLSALLGDFAAPYCLQRSMALSSARYARMDSNTERWKATRAESSIVSEIRRILFLLHLFSGSPATWLWSILRRWKHDLEPRLVCPVWTSFHTDQPHPSNVPSGWRTVLCAVDRTVESSPVMEWAARFADQVERRFNSFTSFPGSDDWSRNDRDLKLKARLKKEAVHAIDSLTKTAWV